MKRRRNRRSEKIRRIKGRIDCSLLIEEEE